MDERPQARSTPEDRGRIRNGGVVAGLICGVVLTLGWWLAIVVGLCHAVA